MPCNVEAVPPQLARLLQKRGEYERNNGRPRYCHDQVEASAGA
jgi:hypothetical protein